MRLSTTAAVATLSSLALAAPTPIGASSGTADIVARQDLGGVAGDRHADARILVPLGRVFTAHPSLDAISMLSLNAVYGADVATVSCTPFKNADGTGDAGASFSKDHPSYIPASTKIGSILCS